MHSHYDTLKVTRHATTEELKRAWKRLSFLNHPDRFPEDKRQAQTEIIKAINEAWRILGDSEARKRYDQWLDQQQATERQTAGAQYDSAWWEQQKRTEQEYAEFWRQVESLWEEEYQLQKRKEQWFKERRREDLRNDIAEKSAAVKSFIAETRVVDRGKTLVRRLVKIALGIGGLILAGGAVGIINEAMKGASQSQATSYVAPAAPTREENLATFYQGMKDYIAQANQQLPKTASKGVTLDALQAEDHTLMYIFTVNASFSKGYSKARLRQNLLDAFDHGNLKKVCSLGDAKPGVPEDFQFAYRYHYRDQTVTVSLPFSEACPAANLF
ncbi:J domain-containing protein [Scandinavium sp. NPDC088450]|uniref:J domain-containing protein n=1 Tax=Scandinavium sp. NPDC088450 TaxID=3364514 RepID=UPI0038508602